MSHTILRDAISKYAHAYEQLQKLQDTLPWIPGGDQKTGMVFSPPAQAGVWVHTVTPSPSPTPMPAVYQ